MTKAQYMSNCCRNNGEMRVTTKSCVEGALKAEGLAVIIDVFRASNTIIACLARGAEVIIPVRGLDEAYDLKRENPQYLLFGERGGLPPEGFDYGNSPAQASRLQLSGKRIIFTTSAGTLIQPKQMKPLLAVSRTLMQSPNIS